MIMLCVFTVCFFFFFFFCFVFGVLLFLTGSESEGKDSVSVRREEDGPVRGADRTRCRSQDGVAEGRALQEVVMRVGRGGGRTQRQWVGGGGGRHCGGHRQGVGQEAGAQSFGEILGEGQRGLEEETQRETSQKILWLKWVQRVIAGRIEQMLPSCRHSGVSHKYFLTTVRI